MNHSSYHLLFLTVFSFQKKLYNKGTLTSNHRKGQLFSPYLRRDSTMSNLKYFCLILLNNLAFISLQRCITRMRRKRTSKSPIDRQISSVVIIQTITKLHNKGVIKISYITGHGFTSLFFGFQLN